MWRSRLPVALCALLSVAAVSIAAQSARTVWDGVYTDAQAKRGRELYNGKCLSCHGADLSGGEMAPPLVGSTFNANWNGMTLGDLMERTRTAMPQNNPGSLSRQQYADILALMLATGKFPAGQAELPRDTELLKLITFEASKP